MHRAHTGSDSCPLAVTIALCIALAGCGGAPLSVDRVGPGGSRRDLSSNALSSASLSTQTRIVLRRRDLTTRFAEDPEDALASLHATIGGGEGGSNELFALAELSFAHAERLRELANRRVARRSARRHRGALPAPRHERPEDTLLRERGRAHHLASALYAFAFLFSADADEMVPLIDPRGRIAADLYNNAVAEAFRDQSGAVVIGAGVHRVPFGEVLVSFDESELRWGERVLVDFVPANEFEVRGLQNRYRRPGLGAPLAAHTTPRFPGDPASDLVAEHTVVTATAVLLFERPREQLAGAEIEARLALFAGANVRPVGINGRTLPLEVEPSTALAASLEESDIWKSALMTFLGRAVRLNASNRLFGWEPRLPGQIPVVFVHGTNSTPAVWANMVNDLQSDPRIRDRYQFLFYAYESGGPILYSSMILRRSLQDAVHGLDPSGRDACLRHMVVIGHSQGGLLTKATAIRSGDQFWSTISSAPFEEAKFTPKTRALLREAIFIEPLPFVDRVIFISTPHRGSFLASSDLVRRLAARLIRMPAEVVGLTVEISGMRESVASELKTLRLSTSIDNMSPGNPTIKAIASMPVSPEITAHSIIAVEGDGPIETGDDGVVKYKSAHIDEAVSEVVVRDSHSTQANPHTVEEVRRILLLHAEEAHCAP